MKYTIACDFDGVLHTYTTSWRGPHIISDPPMPGAFEWLQEMVKSFRVVIYSARFTPRGNTEGDWGDAVAAREGVKRWMMRHGLPVEIISKLEFWMQVGKPTALVYIDDRAFRFEGVFPTKDQIHQLRPWKVTDGER